MNAFFIVPPQTQTGTFPVFVWIIGGDATRSVALSDFTAITSGGGTSNIQIVSNKTVMASGRTQTRVVLAVTPPTGQKGTAAISIPQNAFAIGSARFPTESAGKTSSLVPFDTTGGLNAITWTVGRRQFFENTDPKRFTFEITFSQMLLGDTANLAATSFRFFGAVTSDIRVENVNDSYTSYLITGTVSQTAFERVLNLGLARNAARLFNWIGSVPSYSGYRWPSTDILLADLSIPALPSAPDPEDEEPRRPVPPPAETPESLIATFSELPSAINTTDFTVIVHFKKNRSLQPINVADSEISAANFAIRDGNNVINGASISRIEGQDNWRKLHIRLPASSTGAVYIRVLANTIYWNGGIGPLENIDISPAISYSTPAAPTTPTPEPEEAVVENPVGPDETQLIAAAPMAPAVSGAGFDGPNLIIITPEAGQAIRISEFVNFNTDLTNAGRLVYHNGNFYTFDTRTKALYHVTKEDGTAERIGTATDFGVGETMPSTLFSYGGSLYLIGKTLRKVIQLDIMDGSGTVVGATQINVVNPLGATVFQNQILLAAADGGGLFTLDSSTWKTVRLAGNELYATWNQMEQNMVDMTVHRGRLYGIGTTNDRLYEINPLTGSAIPVNPYMRQFGARLGNMSGLASDGKDLYGVENHHNALFNIRTRGSLPGETSDIIFKFDKPVYDFRKADIVTQWTADAGVKPSSIPDDGDIGDLDPSTGERGTTFQLPVRHRPGFSGILDIAVRAGSAIQAAELGTSAEGAPESATSQAPNQYGPPVPVTTRISYKLTSTTVTLSVPPTTVFSESSFVQTATWSEDIQEGSFTADDVIIRTEGVTLTNFQRNNGNNKIYTWTLNFNDSVNDIVEISINSGSVFDSLGRAAPIEDRFVSFYVDLTAPEASTEVSGVTVLCEETFTIKDNPWLQDLLPEDQRNLVTNAETGGVTENVYGGLFRGVLEYLKMEGLDKSYAVVQIAKPNIFGEGADDRLPAAAVLVEIDSNGCEIIDTFEYSLLAPRSLTQDGDYLYYFIGSHYSYEYLAQWTNPEPPNDQFAPPFFPRPRDVKTYSGEYYTSRTDLSDHRTHRGRYVEQHAKAIAEKSAIDHRALVPDFYQRQSDQETISSILSDRGVLVKYNARTGKVESRQTVWKSKEEDPVTMKTGKEFTDEVGRPIREFTGTASRQTPGYGVYGGMASPMVVANGDLHMVAGFGDQRFIKSTRYKTSQRQDSKVEPVTEIDNWNWITLSKEVEKRLPLLETNDKTYEQVLQQIAETLFCYIGYDANRNLIFRFKEPKQALLKNPVSNRMAASAGRYNLALELKRPNIDLRPRLEKIVDIAFPITAGKIFAGVSGVYHLTSNTLSRINLETGIADQTWDISTFTGVTNFRDVRRNNMFFYGENILAHVRLTNGNEGLYTVNLESQTLTLIGSNPNSVRMASTHIRGLTEHDGLIYGIASNNRSLYRFDSTTGTGTRLGEIDPRWINPFTFFSSNGKLWIAGRTQQPGMPFGPFYEELWTLDPDTYRYGDPTPNQTRPIEFTWRRCTDYLGTTLVLYDNSLYKVELTGLVKVEDELISYAGIGGTENEPVLLNIERAQRDTSIPNNHNVVPVYFIDHVISMTEQEKIKPILDLKMRIDASQVYNVIQVHYDNGDKTYTIDNTEDNEIKRTLDITVPLDKNQFEFVRWLAERYEAWYKDPQIIADTILKSSFYLSLGDIILIEEPESILDSQNLFQTVETAHNVKDLVTKAKFRQIATSGEREEFGHIGDTQLVQNAQFDQTISRSMASASIVALPRDPIPQGVRLNTDTGRVYGIARQIGDSGQTFRVAYAQIIDDQVQTQEVTFTVLPSRPPVWNIELQYFYNTAPISIDLSTYVTGKATITFEAIGTLPSFLTLTGTMLTGTNPRTSIMTARILARNDDGTSEQRFIFARATDPLPVYDSAVYGTTQYPFEQSIPTLFSSDEPFWSIEANYFFNGQNINIDLNTGYILNPTIATFTIIGTKPEWLTLSESRLSGTNPRTSLTLVTIRATNENGSSDRLFYFGRATDHAPQYGSTTYGTAYYI